jgi:hypothetical protein
VLVYWLVSVPLAYGDKQVAPAGISFLLAVVTYALLTKHYPIIEKKTVRKRNKKGALPLFYCNQPVT